MRNCDSEARLYVLVSNKETRDWEMTMLIQQSVCRSRKCLLLQQRMPTHASDSTLTTWFSRCPQSTASKCIITADAALATVTAGALNISSEERTREAFVKFIL